MTWSSNILVVERILCNLDLPDLKSASEVCRAWLLASAKAFEATSRVVIAYPRPDDALDLNHFLQRFQRIKDFKFKLSGRAGAPDGPNSILADLPLEASSTMTRLTLDYEPTAEVLEAINSFLCQLTSRCPALQELQICPNADPAEDLVSPSLDFVLDNLVPAAEHSSLRVLRVPVGPNWGSGIDWRFLTPLKKLEEIQLLQFHVRGIGDFVVQQLAKFLEHFPAEARISKLSIYLRLGIRKLRLTIPDLNALTCLHKSIQPEIVTLYIEQVESDGVFPPFVHVRQYWSLIEQMRGCSTSKRINVHYSMPLTSFLCDRFPSAHVSALVCPLRHYQQFEPNTHVLLHVDICSDQGSPPMSFIELECAQFKAPFVFRHGPIIGDYANHVQDFTNGCLKYWMNDNPNTVGPFIGPNYTQLRKCTIGKNQEIIDQEQFYLADDPGPWNRVWSKTKFMNFSQSLPNVQTSWKTPRTTKRAEVPALPVTTLLVYSLD